MPVNSIMNSIRGKKIIDHEDAEKTVARLCSVPASGDLSNKAANIMAYKMTTTTKQNKIHVGTRITTQVQFSNWSSLRAMRPNCSKLIEAKNSNSHPLAFLIAQKHANIDMRHNMMSGVNIVIHVFLL